MALNYPFKAAQGEHAAGLIMAADNSNELVPYKETAEVLGVGDGSTTAFSGTLANYPLQPGSVTVDDGVEAFSDDGLGRLTGDQGGSGTVEYKSGKVSVTFNTAPTNSTDLDTTSKNDIEGVNVNAVDSDSVVDGTVYIHGTVNKDNLLVEASAPSADDLRELKKKGIFAI